MSICNKCFIELDDRNYAGEGMCHECYLDYIEDLEHSLVAEEEDEEQAINEIMKLLNSRGEDL